MGYSQTSEPIRLERDCEAVMVPQGDEVTLPAGQVGYITQALGGSFTVFVDGNLFRIRGSDADALGKSPPAPLELADDADDAEVEKLVWRNCAPASIPRSRSTSSNSASSTTATSNDSTTVAARSTCA